MNPNLALYKLPTTLEAPNVRTIIVEQAAERGPYGAKGVGEPPVVVPPGAIANAVAERDRHAGPDHPADAGAGVAGDPRGRRRGRAEGRSVVQSAAGRRARSVRNEATAIVLLDDRFSARYSFQTDGLPCERM